IFAHHLYGPLKIDSKKQSYEKEKALRAYVIGTETAIASSLSSFDHLASERWEEINLVFHDFRKSIGKAKLLITPFIDKDIIRVARLEALSTGAQDYFTAVEADAIEAYHTCKSILETYLLQAQKFGGRYSRDLLGALAL